jgi:hypothetical protein
MAGFIHRSAWKRSSALFALDECPCGIMTPSERGRPPRRKEVELRMGDSEELRSKERRRRLIERLNEKEKLIGPQSPASRGEQMSEEELATEIEKHRTLNAARGGGFSCKRGGDDLDAAVLKRDAFGFCASDRFGSR